MDFRFWNFSTPSNMFNSSHQGPFSSNVSSYFRRPSKVVKPSSRNNSPRTSSRRRMTTTGHMPVRTRSVVDRQRASMPQLSDNRSTASRPISWHPNMLDEMSHFQYPNYSTNEYYMATPYTATEMNGLVTPMSYPLINEPQIQELITPLEGLSASEAEGGYGYGQDFDMTQYWLSDQAKDATIDFDPSLYPIVNYPPQWYPANQYIMPNVPTAPTSTSPSVYPINNYPAPMHLTAPVSAPEPPTEELVGMGLYDSPAEVQSSSLLLGGTYGVPSRKSLKLEDSFEPSPNDEEDDDEDEEDAVASEEDDINELGVSPTTMNHVQYSSVGTFADTQSVPLMNSNYTMNHWHMPSQPAYGWI